MTYQKHAGKSSLATIALVFGLVALLLPVMGSATASDRSGGEEETRVVRWVRKHAARIGENPSASLEDLSSFRAAIGDATVVGLGESVHGAQELIKLKHRSLRVLVEELGFRTVAWEEDWTTGLRIDAFLRSGKGDLDALVSQMSDQWHSADVKHVLRWLRRYNLTHRHDVRFVGVDYFHTSGLAYDAVERYVNRVAPARLADAHRHLKVIRPFTGDMQSYYDWYTRQPDKQRYVRHARRLFELVRSIAANRNGEASHLVVHHARQIVSYYENFSLRGNAAFAYREKHAAQNLRWWRNFSGDKVAYWAASTHTVEAPHLRAVIPPYPDIRFPTTGSFLDGYYGKSYVSVGTTFGRGRVRTGPRSTMVMSPSEEHWLEHPFGEAGIHSFVLDLNAGASSSVRRWLHSPIRTRGFGGPGTETYLTGGTAADWFDVVVYTETVAPTRHSS